MSQSEAPRVLVVGSINTDLVMRVVAAPEAGETVTGQSFATFGGGKGANQAVAAARSGASVAMLGGIGDDDFGRQRRADLLADGISVQHVTIFPDLPSGVAIILIETGGENRIAYVPGATWGVTGQLARNAIEQWNPDIVLATLEHRSETLALLWEVAKDRGIPVVCNATPEPAQGRELAFAADILVVNEVEALELLDSPSGEHEWKELARRLRDQGPGCVVITLGELGAVVSTTDGERKLDAVPVDVVDTTGAGDAFCGAFTAALARGSDPYGATRTGVVAGSLAVTRSGAQPSMPTRAEIDHAISRFG